MNDLLMHYNKLLEITQKIYSSSQEDIKIALENLKSAIEGTDSLKLQLDTCLALSKKNEEEIAALERIRKRARTVSYIELGIGIPCLIIGFLPIWTKEQQNIKNLFLGVGGTAITTGAATFVVTVRF